MGKQKHDAALRREIEELLERGDKNPALKQIGLSVVPKIKEAYRKKTETLLAENKRLKARLKDVEGELSDDELQRQKDTLRHREREIRVNRRVNQEIFKPSKATSKTRSAAKTQSRKPETRKERRGREDKALLAEFSHLSEMMALRGWERHHYWKAHKDEIRIESRQYAAPLFANVSETPS